MTTDFNQLFSDIAVELTALGDLFDRPIWSAEIDDRSYHPAATLTASDGRRIRLWVDDYSRTQRVEISGRYPRYASGESFVSYHDNPPQITAAVSRGATAIARDIQRRFLPTFNDFWAGVMDRYQAHLEYVAQKERNTAAILAAWPSAHAVSHLSDQLFLGTRETKHSGKVFISAEWFSLELRHLTLEQVQQIAKIVEPTPVESP